MRQLLILPIIILSLKLSGQVLIDSGTFVDEIYHQTRLMSIQILNAVNSQSIEVYGDADFSEKLDSTSLSQKLMMKSAGVFVVNPDNPKDPYDLILHVDSNNYDLTKNFGGLQFQFDFRDTLGVTQLELRSIAIVYQAYLRAGIMFYFKPDDFNRLILQTDKKVIHALIKRQLTLGESFGNPEYYFNESCQCAYASNSSELSSSSDFTVFMGKANITALAKHYIDLLSAMPLEIATNNDLMDGEYLFSDSILSIPINDLRENLKSEYVQDSTVMLPYYFVSPYYLHQLPKGYELRVFRNNKGMILEHKIRKSIVEVHNEYEASTHIKVVYFYYAFDDLSFLLKDSDTLVLDWILKNITKYDE